MPCPHAPQVGFQDWDLGFLCVALRGYGRGRGLPGGYPIMSLYLAYHYCHSSQYSSFTEDLIFQRIYSYSQGLTVFCWTTSDPLIAGRASW